MGSLVKVNQVTTSDNNGTETRLRTEES